MDICKKVHFQTKVLGDIEQAPIDSALAASDQTRGHFPKTICGNWFRIELNFEEISALATYFEVLLLPKHQQPLVYELTPCQRASGAENELCFVSAMCARSSTRVSKVPGMLAFSNSSKISNNVNWLRKELSFLSLFYIFFNFFYIQLFRGPHTSFISANT